jgi:hypothetical protein
VSELYFPLLKALTRALNKMITYVCREVYGACSWCSKFTPTTELTLRGAHRNEATIIATFCCGLDASINKQKKKS